jgi:hypothetical protein
MERRGAIRWVWAAAFAALATAAGPVGAFYWYGPPEKTIIPPGKGKEGDPPPHHKHKHKHKPPPGGHEPPPEPPPIDVPPVEPTPEPATIFGALLGLGTLAASRAIRHRKAC